MRQWVAELREGCGWGMLSGGFRVWGGELYQRGGGEGYYWCGGGGCECWEGGWGGSGEWRVQGLEVGHWWDSDDGGGCRNRWFLPSVMFMIPLFLLCPVGVLANDILAIGCVSEQAA